MSIFEAVMLVCFGVSWPISNRQVAAHAESRGQKPAVHGDRLFRLPQRRHLQGHAVFDWIIALYALNMVLVAVDLSLYFYYSRDRRGGAPGGWAQTPQSECAP
jgi:hypothetical protein